MKLISFLLTLLLSMGICSIFFSFISYGINMFGFILFILPIVGLIVGGFKAWKYIKQ
jgi:hypothetical protein